MKTMIAGAVILFSMLLFAGCNGKVPEKEGKGPDNRQEEQKTAGLRTAIEESGVKDEDSVFFSKPPVAPQSMVIKIYKARRRLELYGDGHLIGRFLIALGQAPEGDKVKEGDGRTPEGNYYICTRNNKSRFTLFLGISYPGIEDAQRGLDNGLIDRATYDKIKDANERKERPPWDTPLGGEVGIHGGGASSDWTLGCIALSDEDIRILWEYAAFKTPVEIYE